MKTVLINPPNRVPEKWAWGHAANVFQPLGLGYIAAVLEQAGREVSIIDALGLGWSCRIKINNEYLYAGLTFDEIWEMVAAQAPDIVGISIPFSSQAKVVSELALFIKHKNPGISVVLGGPHVSVRPEECLNNEGVDIVVMGEGERTMLELVDALSRKRNLKEIKGLMYKYGGEAINTGRRDFIEDLDSIPFPARHLLPMEEYFKAARAGRTSRHMNGKWSTVITSRGCPSDCVFCCINLSMGKKWRRRSPENVIAELRELKNNYGIRSLDFEDDNLTLDLKRAERIFDLMAETRLDLQWETPNGIRADRLNETLLRKMKRSGCKRLYISPESGDQRVINEIIKKRLDLNDVRKIVALCRKVGIKVTCSFIIGLIGETRESLAKTIAFARELKKLGADRFGFAIATPYYGTELYEQALSGGYLGPDFDGCRLSTSEALIETPEFTREELLAIKEEAQKINFRLSLDNLRIGLKEPRLIIRALRSLFKKHKIRER